MLGCVRACVRTLLVPRDSWRGCAVWVRVLGLGVSAAPRHPWLGCWGVCVLVCALRLYPATPGWVVRLGCLCWGSGLGCALFLLAGVLGCACACERAPLVPRHSWLGCAVWAGVFGLRLWLRPAFPGWGVGVCMFVCTLRLYPATPGWGVRCGCVFWARVSAAPCHMSMSGLSRMHMTIVVAYAIRSQAIRHQLMGQSGMSEHVMA